MRRFFGICLISLVSLIIVLLLVVSCASPAPTAGKTIKVGIISQLTGPQSETFSIMGHASELAADWINSKGGITIKGEKYLIQIILEDEKGTVEGAVAAATKLVNQDKVSFIVGQVMPAPAKATATITEPAKVLRVLHFGADVPGAVSKYTFGCGYGGSIAAYDYLAENYPQVKTIVIWHSDDQAALFNGEQAVKFAEAHGIKVLDNEVFTFGVEDYYPILTKILALKPDAMDEVADASTWAAAKIKQARELGFKGPMFASAANYSLYEVSKIVGKDYANDFFNGSIDENSPEAPPMIREIKQLWANKFGTAFSTSDVLNGWNAMWLMSQAIENAQSLDTTEIATKWEQMKTIETAQGTASMGGLKTFGFNHLAVVPSVITKLDQGEVKIGKIYPPITIP